MNVDQLTRTAVTFELLGKNQLRIQLDPEVVRCEPGHITASRIDLTSAQAARLLEAIESLVGPAAVSDRSES
jgi:hypothetical protein